MRERPDIVGSGRDARRVDRLTGRELPIDSRAAGRGQPRAGEADDRDAIDRAAFSDRVDSAPT